MLWARQEPRRLQTGGTRMVASQQLGEKEQWQHVQRVARGRGRAAAAGVLRKEDVPDCVSNGANRGLIPQHDQLHVHHQDRLHQPQPAGLATPSHT